MEVALEIFPNGDDDSYWFFTSELSGHLAWRALLDANKNQTVDFIFLRITSEFTLYHAST